MNGNGAEKHEKEASDASEEPAKARSSQFWATLKHWLPLSIPPWLIAATKDEDYYSYKIGFRCAVVLWAAYLLIIPSTSLAVLGNAAFFAAIAVTLLAPVFPVQQFVLASLTLLMGIMLGWAWSCAAMASALRARDQVLLAQQVQRAANSVAGQSNPDQLYQLRTFQGYFLDPGSSAVWGAYLAIGTFFFAYVKIKAPRMAFFSIFGTIILSAFATIAPLIPNPDYLLLQTLIISGACGVAIALAASILIFPHSMSYLFGKTLIGTLDGVRQLADLQNEMLALDMHDHEAWSACLPKLGGLRSKLLGGLADLAAKKGMLELEISHGRLSAADLKDAGEKLKTCVFLAGGLRVFPELVAGWHSRQANAKEVVEEKEDGKEIDFSIVDSIRSITELREHMTRLEDKHGHALRDLLPLTRDAAQPLISANHDALASCIVWLKNVNTRRWRAVKSTDLPEHEQQLAVLRKALDDFRLEGRKKVLAPFRSFFDGPDDAIKHREGHLPYSPRALYALLTHQSNLIEFSKGVVDLLELCVSLEKERTSNRFWAPTRLRAIVHVALDRKHDSSVPVGAGNESQEGILEKEPTHDEEKQSLLPERHFGPQIDWRDPDAAPPSNAVQHFFGGFRRYLKWQTGPEGLYCLKYSIVSVAIWMPCIFENTAYFAYANKVLWALIMAQLTLAVYVSDQLAAYIPRLLGTFFGGLLGMIAWYISTGNGTGQPYAFAVVLAVICLPLGFIRAAVPLPSFMGVAMAMATFTLVVGYSWIDTHLPAIVSPGHGFEVWWRRLLLVIVGLTIAFVLMLLPPQSGHIRVRKGAANTLMEIIGLYSTLIEGWIEEEGQEQDKLDPRYVARFRKWHLEVNGRVEKLLQATAMGRFEVTLRGNWNGDAYMRLVKLEVRLLESLQQLANALAHLDEQWRRVVLKRAPMLSAGMISEVLSIATICSRCLMLARPVPTAVAQSLMDRLAVYGAAQPPTPEPGSIVLTWSRLEDAEAQMLAKACIACFSFLSQLDEVNVVITELVGSVDLPNLSKRLRARR